MSKVVINVPNVPTAGISKYVRNLVKEIAITAVVAGAVAGLTDAANLAPVVSAHYGLSPLFTAQAIAVIGSARAFVSGFSSVKVSGSGVVSPVEAVSVAVSTTPPTGFV